MSSDKEMPQEEESQMDDLQLAFVIMLEDNKVLLDKQMTPAIKTAKEKALKELTENYNNNDLWNENENPVIQGVPGGVSAGTSRDVNADRFSEEDFSDANQSIEQSQKTLVLKQINAAIAQEKPAIAQDKAAIAVEKTAGALKQFIENYFARHFDG